MIKVLLDACVPRRLRKKLVGFDIETAQVAGLDHLPDGALLTAIEARYDVLVSRDRNLSYQQNIAGRPVAVGIIRSLDQSPQAYDALLPALRSAISAAIPGTGTVVGEDKA